MARALRVSRSFTIGIVVSEAGLNYFHPYVAHEVQAAALEHGYTVLTLNNAGSGALRDWLAEARAGARAKPLEANLSRGTQGYSGTVVLSYGGPNP